MAFASRLADLRKQRSLTQDALAEAVGVHVSQTRRYEAGTSTPTLDVLRNVAIALSDSADALASTKTNEAPQTTSPSSSKPSAASTYTTRTSPARSSKPLPCAPKPTAGNKQPASTTDQRTRSSTNPCQVEIARSTSPPTAGSGSSIRRRRRFSVTRSGDICRLFLKPSITG